MGSNIGSSINISYRFILGQGEEDRKDKVVTRNCPTGEQDFLGFPEPVAAACGLGKIAQG